MAWAPRAKNFYNDLAVRLGRLRRGPPRRSRISTLAGKKDEAAAAVPDELVRAVSLIGPESYVKERVAAFAEAGVTTLNVTPLAADRNGRVQLIEKFRKICD